MLLVTGMLRSGTTLLEKLLAHHPRLSVLSQPFPFVYIEAKRAFLRSLDRTELRYPLGDLFLEREYSPADFCGFIADYRPVREEVLAWFEAMRGYSGQKTRFAPAQIQAALDVLEGARFAELVDGLAMRLGQPKAADWYGAKETICEEFLPCILAHGGAGVLIVRDPRDMLASLNHGRGAEFTGAVKPTLFNLRQWRKSVAYAIELQSHPRFVAVRYEDLVRETRGQLAVITEMLGVPAFDEAHSVGRLGGDEQHGVPWTGNSSHQRMEGVDPASIGSYSQRLPAQVVDFTEAACFAELRYLGYPVHLDTDRLPETLRTFRDPYADARPELRPYYDHPDRRSEELARYEQLSHSAPGPYFLSAAVHATLRQALDQAGPF